MTPKVALVAGASGVVGRTLVGHLAAQSDWDVIAVSRRAPDIPGRWRHLPLDLLDASACAAATAELARVTHVFHCAFVLDPDPDAHIRRNLTLLVNLVQTVERAGAPLEHVHLVEGTKWYGSHLGPFRTPAKESQPRHAGRNFYFDQQDWLEAAQAGRPVSR